MTALSVLLPDFAIIALGALIGPRISESGWRQVDWLSYHVFYPALLFAAASSRPIDPAALLLIGTLGAAVVTAGFLLAMAVARLGRGDVRTRAGALQNGWRFNTALGFVAVSAMPPQAAGILAILVGISIPLANLYAVTLLTHGQGISRTARARELAFNPFLLASMAGVIVGLSGMPLPSLPMAFVDRLAAAAIPVVLLSLGAALRGAVLWPPERLSLMLHTIKLLLLPMLVWGAAQLLDPDPLVTATTLVFAALPTATAAHVLAARYGADRGRVALVVMQSSALGLVTLPVWTALAIHLAS